MSTASVEQPPQRLDVPGGGDQSQEVGTAITATTTTSLEEGMGQLTVQEVADLAVAAHSGGGGRGRPKKGDDDDDDDDDDEESVGAIGEHVDTHTELMPSFRAISRKTSYKAGVVVVPAHLLEGGGSGHGGGDDGTPAPGVMPLRRAQSLQATRRPVNNLVDPNLIRGTIRRSHSGHHRTAAGGTGSGTGSGGSGHSPVRNSRTLRSSSGRMVPGRSRSSDGVTLRGYRRDQLVNVSIRPGGGKMGVDFDRKDYAVLRTRSGDDLSINSSGTGLDSCFTTDSINLRKSQLIADPLEIVSAYHDTDSCADHDTICDTFSMCTTDFDGYTEYPPDPMGRFRTDASVDNDSYCATPMESFQIRNMHRANAAARGAAGGGGGTAGAASGDEACDISFFSNSASYSDFELDETITEALDENGLLSETAIDETSDTNYSETVE